VFNVIDRQIQLIIVGFRPSTILGAAIRQYPQHGQLFVGKERLDFVVQQIGSGDRRFGGIQLGKRHFGVGIDKGLRYTRPTPLKVPTEMV
jgi:hypothetical protein